MQSIHDYDVYIFDCDGVILDSNRLKIDAMERALNALSFDQVSINRCIDYFRRNFGKSRFHHVDVFLEEILSVNAETRDSTRDSILNLFSDQCKSLYLEADITPGFEAFIRSLKGNLYIASGSEQNELRMVFKARALNHYFTEIYGSPTKKAELVKTILLKEGSQNAIMFGDALSDLDAALSNDIDFTAYTPFSNVPEDLAIQTRARKQNIINDWSELK